MKRVPAQRIEVGITLDPELEGPSRLSAFLQAVQGLEAIVLAASTNLQPPPSVPRAACARAACGPRYPHSPLANRLTPCHAGADDHPSEGFAACD